MDKKVTMNTTTLKIISLYLGDYSKKLHLRKIASILDVNHRTISLHLKDLENMKIFKSEYIGKHKEFYLNLDNALTRFYLSASENYIALELLSKNFLLKKVFSDLSKEISVENSIILFGSYTKGEEKPESDIDILVIGKLKDKNFVKEIEERYDKKINIKTATTSEFSKAIEKNDFLVVEILKKHIVLRNQDIFVNLVGDYYEKIIKK